MKFSPDSSGDVALCDGTHASLGSLVVGDAAPAPVSKNAVPDATPTPEEPTVQRIHELARDGLSKLGHHGEMGVPRAQQPLTLKIPLFVSDMSFGAFSINAVS